MGDMLNSVMFKANVVHQREIGARIRDDAKNAQPWMEGKKHLNNIYTSNSPMLTLSNVEGRSKSS